jgi:hypothetical protein
VSGQAFAFVFCRIMAMLLAMAPWPAPAQDAPADILFARPHLSGVPSGTELTYRLERSPSDAKRLGAPFSDDIKLVVRSDPASSPRDIELRIFTGERARESMSMTGLTGNPVLVIFLDRAVSNMAHLTGGSAPYFKGRLRVGLRDKATAEAASVEFEGKMLDAKRIVVRPFVDDAMAARMLGYVCSVHHHAPDRLALMHQVEAGIDLVEAELVGDQVVDVDLALHVPVDDLRHIGAPARAAERPCPSRRGR